MVVGCRRDTSIDLHSVRFRIDFVWIQWVKYHACAKALRMSEATRQTSHGREQRCLHPESRIGRRHRLDERSVWQAPFLGPVWVRGDSSLYAVRLADDCANTAEISPVGE